MGGGFVLQLAIADPTLAAGVIYYGPVVVDGEQLRRIHTPLLGYFGQEDRSIPVPAVRMLANALNDSGDPIGAPYHSGCSSRGFGRNLTKQLSIYPT